MHQQNLLILARSCGTIFTRRDCHVFARCYCSSFASHRAQYWPLFGVSAQEHTRFWQGDGRVQLSDTPKNLLAGLRMSTVAESDQKQDGFFFGQYRISLEEIFLVTKLSFVFVNLRPVVPVGSMYFTGDVQKAAMHITETFGTWCPCVVQVIPKRVVARFTDLSAEEVTDLWLTAQRVGEKLESFFNGSSLTLAIQDGPEAGQSVPHVHVHILPRKKADFEENDQIYDEIDKKEKELKDNLNLDEERKDRDRAVMHEEATKLRALF